jgi:hypothetical protein
MFNKFFWNNIKSKPVTGICVIVGYFGMNFYINYKCFQYVKTYELNIYNYYLMIL